MVGRGFCYHHDQVDNSILAAPCYYWVCLGSIYGCSQSNCGHRSEFVEHITISRTGKAIGKDLVKRMSGWNAFVRLPSHQQLNSNI